MKNIYFLIIFVFKIELYINGILFVLILERDRFYNFEFWIRFVLIDEFNNLFFMKKNGYEILNFVIFNYI